MKKSVRRALAATTVTAALAATMAASPSAVAGQAAPSPKAATFANYGFKGVAEGVKLYVNDVQFKSLKDAVAPLRCTRKIGRTAEATSVLTAPENSLIQLSASTSRTLTYAEGARKGVKAVNTLGDITIGDAGLGTPVVTIKGLTTVADAFHNADGYGHEESISQMELGISGLPEEINQPLQDLLDAIDTGVLQPVLDVLESVSAPIEIPDLGTLALSGRSKGTKTNHHAESDAAALELVVTATGETQKLLLGHSRARIGGPAPSGVFRSTSMPLEVDALDGAARFGGVHPRTIPCEGTGGVVRTRTLDTASVLLPEQLLAGVSGMEYSYMGEQHRDGTAEGFNSQKVGSFTIDSLGLEITGIQSKVVTKKVRSTQTASGYKIVSQPKFSVAKIVYNGTEYAVPKPGKLLTIEGLGVVETRVVEATKWGKRVTALRLTLTEYGNTKVDLGISASQIFGY